MTAGLPLVDGAGNALVGYHVVAESRLAALDARIPLPASLVVVECAGEVLMVFDRWRAQWELPGGMLDPGETAREAAVRELAEETGITATTAPEFAAVAEFELRRPARREYAAIYRVGLRDRPRLLVNDEISDFLWWDPHAPVRAGMSPLDAEIGSRVFEDGFSRRPPVEQGHEQERDGGRDEQRARSGDGGSERVRGEDQH